MGICGYKDGNGGICFLSLGHHLTGSAHMFSREVPCTSAAVKVSKKERIAALESELELVREELAHQRGKVQRSQARHVERTRDETELRSEIQRLVTANVAVNRSRAIAQSERDAAVNELRVERSRHDDTKVQLGDAEASHDTVQQTVNDLRKEMDRRVSEHKADLLYWQDRTRQTVREMADKQLTDELARRLAAKK